MMKGKVVIEFLSDHITKYTVKNHPKDELLSLIEEMINRYGIELNNQGYYYDYLEPKLPRPYKKLARSFMDIAVHEMAKERYYSRLVKTTQTWFQQYPENTRFGWHNHPQMNFAVVYYVELPDGASTWFDPCYPGKSDYQVNAKEGDIIMFPTFLPHKSESHSKGRKTIISYNADVLLDKHIANKRKSS